MIPLVLDNELAIAESGADGQNPPVEIQTTRVRISHRLKLLGSELVQGAYGAYRKLVFQETAHSIEYRPQDPDDVVNARNRLIDLMADDVQDIR